MLPDWSHGIHHDSSEMYVSNPLPELNETVTIRLRTPVDAPILRVYLRSRPDGEFKRIKMQATESDAVSTSWTADMRVPMMKNNYVFQIILDDGSFYFNALGVSPVDSPDWFHFTLLADYDAPLWVRETVFYQIFPDRFHNGDPSNDVQDGDWTLERQVMNMSHTTQHREWGELPYPWLESGSLDFFGGDLQGIAQKLDYLAELGVNGIYTTPIFDAKTNHFYDIIDYHNVAPHLGGNEALADLREAMTEQNMRLMLDITPNHLGYMHPWYQQAQADLKSEEAEYFYYREDTQSFEHWLGVPLLVKLNYHSQKLRDAMYGKGDSAIRKWLQAPYHIDGWRLDVANMTGNFEKDQLDHEVWYEMREAIKDENATAYMLGEYFQDGTPYLQGDELDAGMNYQGFNIPVRRWLGGADLGVEEDQPFGDPNLLPTEAMAVQWKQYLTAIPYVIALQQFNQLGSHDVSRILTVCDGDKALVKLGTTLLMTFPGVPCLYYADEIGMEGGHDPDNRRCMPWDENRLG